MTLELTKLAALLPILEAVSKLFKCQFLKEFRTQLFMMLILDPLPMRNFSNWLTNGILKRKIL